jgi:hypothetical protein
MQEKRNAYRALMGKPERHQYENASIGGRITIIRILEKQDGVVWTALICPRPGASGALLWILY